MTERALNLLDLVLSKFDRKGHPGEPCLRTDWIAEDVIATWRDVAAELRAAASPAPSLPGEQPGGQER